MVNFKYKINDLFCDGSSFYLLISRRADIGGNRYKLKKLEKQFAVDVGEDELESSSYRPISEWMITDERKKKVRKLYRRYQKNLDVLYQAIDIFEDEWMLVSSDMPK